MELIPQSDEYAQRLLSPQWDLVEEHFGTTISSRLKEFYADPSRVLQSEFDLVTAKEVEGERTIHIQSSEPISSRSIEAFEGFERFMEIASDGGEGLYFIDPRESDPEVCLFVMDGYDLYPTGLSLSEFLTAPRLEPPGYEPDEPISVLSPWPFGEPPSTAVWTTMGVMRSGETIIHATKETSDGRWRFSSDRDSFPMIVLLREITALDPSIAEIHNLPSGYEATRSDRNTPWSRRPIK